MSLFETLTGAGGGGAITTAFRAGFHAWEKVRTNFNTLNTLFTEPDTGSPEGVVTAAVGAQYVQTDGAGGRVLWLKAIGAGNTGWVIVPAISAVMAFTIWWPAAIRDGIAYLPGWDSNEGALTDDPVPENKTGSNQTYATATYPDARTAFMSRHFMLPADWDSASGIDLRLLWQTGATMGNVVWQVSTAFVADNAVIDAAFNTAQTITDAAKGTANRLNTASLTALTLTGAVASSLMFLQIKRDPTHVSDTITADAALIGVELIYRRTVALA